MNRTPFSRRFRDVCQGVLPCVLLLGLLGAGPANAAIPGTQRAYLQALYTSTGGGSWSSSTSWNDVPGSECNWFGVQCDAFQTTVTGLLLTANNLVGTLPSNLSDLPGLKTLQLGSNTLSGSIPALSSLTSLETVILSNNQFSGSIPSLAGLTNLQILHLHTNQLTGTIPPLTGLTNLVQFLLFTNQLSGSIPSLTGLTNLSTVQLQNNMLTGSLPTLTGLTSLTVFFAFNNLLTGTIPSLSGLTNLVFFHVHQNGLTGTLPSLAGLTSLVAFVANQNQLTGSIPSLAGLTNLTTIHLFDNMLSGPIPSLTGSPNLQVINLNNNRLTGNIPSVTGLNLTLLWLRSNNLVGAIDASLGGLTSLGASGLDLRWNGLYSASAPLITFLNSKQLGGDWQSTQTIAPTGLSTSAPMMNSITVNWTPITYTADTGFYEVLHSTTMGGPYTLFGTMTANKSATSLTVTGLLPNTTYYCVARATTNPHGFNVNTVVSELSAEVPCMTALPVELMRFTVE